MTLSKRQDKNNNDFGDEIIVVSPYLRTHCFLMPVAALLIGVVVTPLVLLVMLLVRLTSRGPVFYRQMRVGKDGTLFSICKIRTMTHNAEATTGPVWATPNDSRITKIGRFLRRSHLDELPQLLNILRGEMSLLGPRPERPEIVCNLVDQVSGYSRRLSVLPGVTGLAQVQLPPDENIDSVRRKQWVDAAYVQTATPLLDVKILICTVLQVFGMGEARSLRLCRIAQTPIPDEIFSTNDRTTHRAA